MAYELQATVNPRRPDLTIAIINVNIISSQHLIVLRVVYVTLKGKRKYRFWILRLQTIDCLPACQGHQAMKSDNVNVKNRPRSLTVASVKSHPPGKPMVPSSRKRSPDVNII